MGIQKDVTKAYIIALLVCIENIKLFFLFTERNGNSLLEGNTKILGFFFVFQGKTLSPCRLRYHHHLHLHRYLCLTLVKYNLGKKMFSHQKKIILPGNKMQIPTERGRMVWISKTFCICYH